jgi:hypothetical protein
MAKEATRNGVIFGTFVVTIALFLSGLNWLKSYFTVATNREVYRKVLEPPNPALLDMRVEESRVLGSYGWVDKDKGVVRIPVERAMDLLIEEARRGPGGEEGRGTAGG